MKALILETYDAILNCLFTIRKIKEFKIYLKNGHQYINIININKNTFFIS
jgi:hypothetical protein